MAMAPAATSATVPTAATRWSSTAAGVGGSENGKFFSQPDRATMRASRAFPMAGAGENFTVALALLAMEFVNRHEKKVISVAKSSRRDLDFPFSFNSQRLTFAHDPLATGD